MEHRKLTVSTTDSVETFSSGGPNFPIPYRFLQNSDIEAVLTKQDGTTETLTGAQYTLTGAGAQRGGTLTSTYAAGVLAAPGATLTVSRVMVAVQPTDLRNQGRFLAETHENVFDRLTMLIQQGFAWTRRALLRPIGKDYYDAEGRRIANVGDPVLQGDAVNKLSMEQYVASVIASGSGNLNLASNVLFIGPDGVTYTVQDIADTINTSKGAALIGYNAWGANTTAGDVLDQLSKYALHPSFFGYAAGADISTLLNTVQLPFDLQGDSYIVTAGVTRAASLRNGMISYGGGTTTGAFANAIVAFTTTEDLDASRLHVKYTGSASSVIGICAYGGTHNINLRGCLAENTPGQGIRVQGCDDPDLTGCEALNCVRDSVGSTDLGLTYGAIAVFGESSVCNRAKLHNCNVSGTSTGISISYGSGHSVRDCVLKCTDKTASPEITMGIYCIGLLTDLEIYRNSIASYPLESIDIHNTGASPVAGVSGIRIHHNVVRDGGYLGVSVICAAPVLIRDVSIHDNILEINPAEAPDGFGGGIQCQQVRSLMLARNRCYCLTTPSVPLATFGIQINSCSHVSSESNYHQGAWGIYESYADWETLRVSGTDGDLLSAGSEGIRLTQTRASASGQLNGVRLVGTASGSKVVRQVGVPLTVFTMQNNYLNGRIDMAAGINDGLVSDNLFRNFSGSLVLGTATIAYNNPGWLDFVTASASPVPGTIKAWAPYRRGANTYYMPLYQPTTM